MARKRREFGSNLASLDGWRRADEDVTEEMRLHVELRARELEAGGLPAADALDRAWREVGDPSVVAGEVRQSADRGDRASAWRQRLDEFVQDLRLGLRVFRRQPLLSVLGVVIIAVGLGANAAVFAIVNTVYFRPLPFDPDNRLVRVREVRVLPDGTRINGDASRRTADAVADRADLFSMSVAVSGSGRALAREGGALRVAAMRVGPGFTRVVGIAPQIGRTFTAEEERAGEGAGAVLLSDRAWRRLFGADAQVLGTSIRLDGQPFSIVGVLPPAFHVPYDTDMWFPSRFGENERSIFILARLADGVSIEQVRAALEPVAVQLNALYPGVMRGLALTAVFAREYFVGNEDRAALALMAAVVFLLLIACTNVAVLLATRFTARRTEVAVRAALGCGRERQVRQFVTEGLVLFAAGGAFGLLVALALRNVAAVFLPEALGTQVGIQGVAFDLRVLAFAGLLSGAAGIGFGLLAAVRASRTDLHGVMKDAGRSAIGQPGRGLLNRLVIGEVALALVLVTAAGVMVQTFRALQQRDLGFSPAGLVTGRLDLNADRYGTSSQRLALVESVLERLRAQPGVEAASATTVNPICCGNWGARLMVEGHPEPRLEDAPVVQHYVVTPEYFATMGMSLVAGRNFTAADREGSEPVTIVDRAFADHYWPGESALGRRVRRAPADPAQPWITIVGVVEPIVDEGEYPDTWYLPHAQHAMGPSANGVHLMLRTDAGPVVAGEQMRLAVAGLDPNLALFEVRAMEAIRGENISQDRLAAIAVSTFATAGLLLAAVGLYGVLAFVVTTETREIGLRLALGSSRASVLGMVLLRGMKLTGIGLAAGIVLAVVGLPGLRALVPEADLDWRLLAAAAGAMIVASALASLIPARRALRLDPITALRAD